MSCGGIMKSIKKDDIKDLSYKDITNIILENNKSGMNTIDLFTTIVNLLELPNDTIDTKIADYYTSLTTDKRFLLVDGLWDLRSRHTSDKVLVDATEEELEDEEEYDEMALEEEEIPEDDFEDDIDGDSTYDEDDGLGDLVVIDEDEMDIDNG